VGGSKSLGNVTTEVSLTGNGRGSDLNVKRKLLSREQPRNILEIGWKESGHED